ncbi:MAG: hypothetical protein LIO55_04665, partial [Oscillospiraceae bacterium]|nr:hypothetical protein [Oscillospiraceae bacterium]
KSRINIHYYVNFINSPRRFENFHEFQASPHKPTGKTCKKTTVSRRRHGSAGTLSEIHAASGRMSMRTYPGQGPGYAPQSASHSA